MKRFVLDCSIAMSWCFEDEKTPYTESVLNALAFGTQAVVPPIWCYEVLNVLIGAHKLKRITQAHATSFWNNIQALPISIEPSNSMERGLEIMALAQTNQLSSYDAAYLELALREGLPLATLDNNLKRAAHATGVEIVQIKTAKN